MHPSAASRLMALLLVLLPTLSVAQGARRAPARDTAAIARRLIAGARYATLVTLDESGAPRSRTVQPRPPERDFRVWFATNPRTRKVEDIARDPRVVLHYFDPARSGYVSLTGRARVVRDRATKDAHWDPAWTAFYKDRDQDVVLVEVTPDRLEIVSDADGMTGDRMTWRPPQWKPPVAPSSVPPAFVDFTWLSISNLFTEIGTQGILTDGYITRLPRDAFSGGGGGYAVTSRAFRPDVPAVQRVLNALGGPSRIQLLLTGHSHWDHSFDTGTWAKLTRAPVIGSRTTCLQVRAEGIPEAQCTTVNGGERRVLAPGVTMYVVRWNHSGDPATNPEQHNPVELRAVPTVDPATGGLRAGVAEDFPNGGGNRAFLFVVDGPEGRYSWFFQNSASAVDLEQPIIVDGVNFGAPLANLKQAMAAAKLEQVDLWIGTGGAPVAALVLPVLRPKAVLPVHWDSFFTPFADGPSAPYRGAALDSLLRSRGVALVTPRNYFDKWRLDVRGVRAIPNDSARAAAGVRTR